MLPVADSKKDKYWEARSSYQPAPTWSCVVYCLRRWGLVSKAKKGDYTVAPTLGPDVASAARCMAEVFHQCMQK